MTCEVCGWRQATRDGRCDACYMFRRRNRRDKTEDEVVDHGRKMWERQFPWTLARR